MHQEAKKNEEETHRPASCMILKMLVTDKNFSKENCCKERKIACQSLVAWLSRDKNMNEYTYNCSKLWVVKDYISFIQNCIPAFLLAYWADMALTCRMTLASLWTSTCCGNAPQATFIIGAKNYTSIQMNVTEVDRVTDQFNGYLKIYVGPSAGWMGQMILSSDWIRLMELSQRIFGQKR